MKITVLQYLLVFMTMLMLCMADIEPKCSKFDFEEKLLIGVGRGGARGGPGPPNNLRGGGGNIPFGPPNNPPTFSFSFYVKQEKITKCIK